MEGTGLLLSALFLEIVAEVAHARGRHRAPLALQEGREPGEIAAVGGERVG